MALPALSIWKVNTVLFTSPVFLFLFLPLLLLFAKMGSYLGPERLGAVLLVASLGFYASWDLTSLVILCILIGVNFWIATLITLEESPLPRPILLALGIGLTLLPLLWFKYADFLAGSVAYLLNIPYTANPTFIPPGISFYTFIQIAWLVSVYRGSVVPTDIMRHALFSSFFPCILSGPIVRYEQMGPQFDRLSGPDAERLALGLSLFCVGMAKKVLLADNLAPLADAVFGAWAKGLPLASCEAWLGALSYSFQLYFDFSGYTDMAIGLGLLFGLQLPENFISPYKATGIVDFWRRWHITLGLWLRDFLYIPLGGNRAGKARQYLNLFVTMLIGGAWHGAGWTFIVWGALHGAMLCINHAFRSAIKGSGAERILALFPLRALSIALTFFCLTLCWVFFRAESLPHAASMLTCMFTGPWFETGPAGVEILPNNLVAHWYSLAILPLSALLIWFFPCSHEIFTRRENVPSWLRFRFSGVWAVSIALLFVVSVLSLSDNQAFLYFQF